MATTSLVARVTKSATAGNGVSLKKGAQDLPNNDTAVNIRGAATNSTKVEVNSSQTVEVRPQVNQPSTTPLVVDQPPLPLAYTDAYRSGSYIEGATDNLSNPRTLGDRDDSIATISITTDSLGKEYRDLVASNNYVNSGNYQGDIITSYSRFFLQGVSESQVEKYQVVETFTAFYSFFYGKRPSIYSFRGTLINDYNHKWTNDLMFFYENYFRGTRSAELSAQAVISYDGRLVSGFIVGLNIQQISDLDKGAAFSMDVLVTEHIPTYFSQDIVSLVRQATIDLAVRAALIKSQVEKVNRSIPGLEKNLADNVAAEKRAPVTATKEAKKEKKQPVNGIKPNSKVQLKVG